MTTGLFALQSRLLQQHTNCSVRESRLFDEHDSFLLACEFVLVLWFDKFEITGFFFFWCRERTISSNSGEFE